MLFLLLSIVCASALVLFFKFFELNKVPIFQAIVFNYWSAGLCSFIFLPDKSAIYSGGIFLEPWIFLALGLGSLFIVIFNLTSLTTVRSGVSVASVASKLGLVFPVILAFIIYNEPTSFLKIAGICLAFVAVILSSLKEEKSHNTSHNAFLPLLVFFGSGACDSFTQLAIKQYIGNSGIEEFTIVLFLSAALAGSILFLYNVLFRKTAISFLSMKWGIVLGIVNYFSFLFLLKALSVLNWGSSVIFPLNNLGVVALSTIGGVLIYRENLNRSNVIGLLLAGIAIVAIAFS